MTLRSMPATQFCGRAKTAAFPARLLLTPGKWHLLAATFDGEEFHLYSDGVQVAGGKLDLGSVSPELQIAPPVFPDPLGSISAGRSPPSLWFATVVRPPLRLNNSFRRLPISL